MDIRVDVLCCGLVTLDVVQDVAALPGADEKVTSREARVDFGGPAANAARTALQLGSTVRLVTMVGRGPVADVIGAQLTTAGLAVLDVTPAGAAWQPPVSAVVVDGAGHRSVVSANAGSAPPAGAPDAPPDARVLLVDGHHLPTALAVTESCRRAGAVVVLDGGSWKPGLEQLLPMVDIVVASADFTVPNPYLDLLHAIPVFATSRGPAPIDVRIGEHEHLVRVPAVRAVDTLGAGDVLHGAFAHHLAANLPVTAAAVLSALEHAAAVAAHSCTRRGVALA